MTMQSWAATDQGGRRTNQDRYLSRPEIGLWAVADGAGGHEAGEVAATLVVEALAAIPVGLEPAPLLAAVCDAIGAAHAATQIEAAARNGVVASTVVALLAQAGFWACVWMGDSRAYLLRDGALRQVTRDHSLVQELVDIGTLSPEAAETHPHANVVTRAVGVGDEPPELDKVSGAMLPGDRFLLCSDGLTKCLSAEEISTLLGAPGGVPPTELLLAAALARGAKDNVTVLAAYEGA